MYPKISAIITTYKRAPDIVGRAVNSVLGQTYDNYEVIVVDDSPVDYELRDEVEKHITSLDSPIIYIKHEKNKGACAARNTGLDAASGEYIAYLDDDDEWLPEKLEKQIVPFSNPNIGLVYCNHYYLDERNNISHLVHHKRYEGYVYDKLIIHNFIGSTSYPLIKKEVLLGVGGFDVEMQSSQDYDLWLRISQKNQIAFVDEALVVYHYHVNDRITSDVQKKLDGFFRLREKNHDYLEKNKEAKWSMLLETSLYYSLNGELGKAFCEWYDGVRCCPTKFLPNMRFFMIVLKNYFKSFVQRK